MLCSGCLEILIIFFFKFEFCEFQWDNRTCAQDWKSQLMQDPTYHRFSASPGLVLAAQSLLPGVPGPTGLPFLPLICDLWCLTPQGGDQVRWQGWQWEYHNLPWPSAPSSKDLDWAGTHSTVPGDRWWWRWWAVGQASHSPLIQAPKLSQNSSCNPLRPPIHQGVGHWEGETVSPPPSQIG